MLVMVVELRLLSRGCTIHINTVTWLSRSHAVHTDNRKNTTLEKLVSVWSQVK